jgi:hypothetical protein
MAKQNTLQKKKLSATDVELVAAAFFTAFQTLPGAVRWRVVQMVEEWEDEREESWHMAQHLAYVKGETGLPKK